MESKIYYTHINGEQKGPLTKDEIEKQDISPQTMVWREDMPHWVVAKDLAEIAILFTEKKNEPKIELKTPQINIYLILNTILQVIIFLSFVSIFEESVEEPLILFFLFSCFAAILLNLFSFLSLRARKIKAARILMMLSIIPYLPLGVIGYIGTNKAIENSEN